MEWMNPPKRWGEKPDCGGLERSAAVTAPEKVSQYSAAKVAASKMVAAERKAEEAEAPVNGGGKEPPLGVRPEEGRKRRLRDGVQGATKVGSGDPRSPEPH